MEQADTFSGVRRLDTGGDMIREAGIDDLPRLVCMGRDFFNETELWNVTSFDEQSAMKTLSAMITNKDSVILVAEKDGVVVGVAGAVIVPFYFNMAQQVAQEFFWFVEREYRNGSVGIRLYDALEQWARDGGAGLMSMAALGCNPSVSKFYFQRGYYQQETNYLRRL